MNDCTRKGIQTENRLPTQGQHSTRPQIVWQTQPTRREDICRGSAQDEVRAGHLTCSRVGCRCKVNLSVKNTQSFWTLLRVSKGRVVLMVHHPRSIHDRFYPQNITSELRNHILRSRCPWHD